MRPGDAARAVGRLFGRAVSLHLPRYAGDLASLVAAHGLSLAPPIGEPGFSPPDLGRARVARRRGALIVLGGTGAAAPFRIGTERGVRDNLVVVGARSRRIGAIRFQGSRNLLVIGEDISWPLDMEVRFSSDEGRLFIGRGVTSNGTTIILEGRGASVTIGDDCMFAAGTAIRTSDLHAIYDRDSGRCLNPPADVLLGPHVWVGQDALVAKGARVGGGSVIGAKSLVTGEHPGDAVLGGVPARVLRRGIAWSRERPR